MKTTLLILTFILLNVKFGISQTSCDSVYFYSDTIYINQSTDDSVRVRFDYWGDHMFVYPGYSITLSDTTSIVFRTGTTGSVFGDQDSIDFEITYKNPSIPSGYTVTGYFIAQNGSLIPPLYCQFPLTIIFGTLASIENYYKGQEFELFPNPFFFSTTIQSSKIFKDATLTVYNSYGQQVKQIKNISGQTVTLFRDNLASGLYFIRLTQDNKIITIDKLVITD